MVSRSASCIALALISLLGCPEPGDEAGDTWGTGETGETGSSDTSTSRGGVEDGGDVHPPPEPGDGDGDPGDGDGAPDEFIDHLGRCWDRSWNGDSFPAMVFDNTIGRNDDFTGSCGLGPAPDFQLGFQAPWTGSFTFDASGSSFDSVIYVNEGECGVEELACNDDFVGLDAKLTIHLQQWELVTITVDGTNPFEQGPLVLTISEAEPPVCEPVKINGNLPKLVVGDTSLANDLLTGDCGGAGAPEQVYEFVAPGPGSYHFDTEGSSFDTVLYTLDACDGPPLACSDDVDFEPHSEISVDLVGGQKILVVVDGHDANDFGEFMLNVEQL